MNLDRVCVSTWSFHTEFEQGRMDLLTVLEHEVGHLLGREAGACGVTLADLATGTRQTVHPVAGPGGVVSGVDLTGVEWVGNRK